MILVQDMMRTDITGLMKKIPEEKGFQERRISLFFYRNKVLPPPCTFNKACSSTLLSTFKSNKEIFQIGGATFC
jgi:hypothetical protein